VILPMRMECLQTLFAHQNILCTWIILLLFLLIPNIPLEIFLLWVDHTC
jgi:hypothetical protein